MRSLCLTGTFAALLAGCASGESARTPAKTIDAPASAAASPPPAAPGHGHDQSDSIPAAYHGVYDASLEACTRPSDGRLTVSVRELRFHESIGSVRAVTNGGYGAIAVEADFEGEGERWRSLRILSLTDNGARLTVKGEGSSLDRVRCPKGVR
jgi:hypothetical protein